MPRRYLVLSDLHLCDVEEHGDGWKSFKSAAYLFDEALDALVRRFTDETPAGVEAILVLNGDVFDFDLVTTTPASPPWPVSLAEKGHGLHPSEQKSVYKLEQMLAFHPVFLRAIARFIAAGHSVVYVLGNHDRELHFAAVQRAFAQAVERAAGELGATIAPESVRFEPWFFYVPGEIYVEHGQQYDQYTSFRHLLAPVVEQGGEPRLALPMGNLSNRHLLNRMGFFNPHASDYILNIYSYVAHWLRHYALTRRSLVLPWLIGSVVVMLEMFNLKRLLLAQRPSVAAEREAIAKRYGLSLAVLDQLEALQRAPITARFFGIIRELWLDRVALALLLTSGTLALALAPVPLWVKLMLPLSVFPLVYFIYEEIVKGETIFTIEHTFPEVARAVGELLSVKLVTFGHTHKPRLIPLDRDLVFVDTGTWAPIMRGLDDRRLVAGYRNYLVADFTGPSPTIQLRAE
jgi:UDP-2,3-diacylglucosamine pyrophosphatase LpxH